MGGAEAAVWEAVEQGGLLLTSQARLARALREVYDARQLAAGRRAWPAAGIGTLQEWYERAWAAGGERICLTPAQEAVLWEQSIVAVAGEPAWLDLPATAATAATGWRLMQEWMLPQGGPEWHDGEDCAAFQQWAREFARRCEAGGWISSAEVPLKWVEGLATGRFPAPQKVWLAGFDRLNPQQQMLCRALERAGTQVRTWDSGGELAPVSVAMCRDPEQELRAAAEWARGEVEQGSGTVAVIVPDLGVRRAAVERTFDAEFHPGRPPWSEAGRAFHLSLGAPLSEVPLVSAALRCGRILSEPEPVEISSVLDWIRSPFLGGGDSESEARAGLERRLREQRRARWGWSEVERAAAGAGCVVLAAILGRALRARRQWPPRQSCAGWVANLQEVWAAAGWPGEGEMASGSHAFQARVAFERLLDSFAQLDPVIEPLTAVAALARLQRMAADRIFQPEAAPAPVQVMGWLEAAGQNFAAVRVCGMHDGAVPGGARPHPFLPLRLQRAHQLPHAAAVDEAEFAARVWQRVRGSSARVTASYAGADAAGGPQLPSPLLAGWPTAECQLRPAGAPNAVMMTVADGVAPECLPSERQGGSALLRDQAQCAFRAFARHRLRASAFANVGPGLDAAIRGTLAHALLRGLWAWLESSERLRDMAEEELRREVTEQASELVRGERRLDGQAGLAAVERDRLTALGLAWLKVEGERQPFRILALEEQRQSRFAGLDLRLKPDRVDALEAGGRVLVDYKTGEAERSYWEGGRPLDPQLPLYLVTDPRAEEVGGLVFGRVRAGQMGWAGRERSEHLLRQHGKPATFKEGWAAQVQQWRTVLERLAEEYVRGEAAVDPLPKVCERCDLAMLCRIRERDGMEDLQDDDQDDDAPEPADA